MDTMNNSRLFPILSLLSLALALSACSSGVSVTAKRFSGVVMDRTMAVEVGAIHGRGAEEFRRELISALYAQGNLGSGFPSATLLIEGTYTVSMDEHTSTETVEGETREETEQYYTARFDYRILHKETGDEVTFGNLEESTSRSHEHKRSRPFFEALLDAFVSILVSTDPYAELREDLIARFIAEISPREVTVEVTLFEDRDMPELEQGIRMARAGKWKEALGMFLDAIERHRGHEEIHKAYYDAGVAYEYTHQYSHAREFLGRALELHDEPEYELELNRCIRYEREWKWREEYLEKLRLVNGN